jgi:RNA polymerase sporulation-specific sigma factor
MENYKDIETNRLILLVRNRDDDAFSELLERYSPMINKVIGSFLDSGVSYDEAYSEGCVALHRAALAYDTSRSTDITFGLFARICVYRRICDTVSGNKKTVQLSDVDVNSIAVGSGLEERLVNKERMEKYFIRAKEILSEYEYEVFMLYMDGASSAEMAEKLSRSIKSIENAKSRMLKTLRQEGRVFFGD